MKKPKRNTLTYLLFIILVFILVIKGFDVFSPNESHREPFRNISHLILTKHAKCRMACRQITQDEIRQILKDGVINYKKSGIGSQGDSTFAVEGYSHEKQHIRVVVAPENDGLVVITCIDLDREWSCDCN